MAWCSYFIFLLVHVISKLPLLFFVLTTLFDELYLFVHPVAHCRGFGQSFLGVLVSGRCLDAFVMIAGSDSLQIHLLLCLLVCPLAVFPCLISGSIGPCFRLRRSLFTDFGFRHSSHNYILCTGMGFFAISKQLPDCFDASPSSIRVLPLVPGIGSTALRSFDNGPLSRMILFECSFRLSQGFIGYVEFLQGYSGVFCCPQSLSVSVAVISLGTF